MYMYVCVRVCMCMCMRVCAHVCIPITHSHTHGIGCDYRVVEWIKRHPLSLSGSPTLWCNYVARDLTLHCTGTTAHSTPVLYVLAECEYVYTLLYIVGEIRF